MTVESNVILAATNPEFYNDPQVRKGCESYVDAVLLDRLSHDRITAQHLLDRTLRPVTKASLLLLESERNFIVQSSDDRRGPFVRGRPTSGNWLRSYKDKWNHRWLTSTTLIRSMDIANNCKSCERLFFVCTVEAPTTRHYLDDKNVTCVTVPIITPADELDMVPLVHSAGNAPLRDAKIEAESAIKLWKRELHDVELHLKWRRAGTAPKPDQLAMRGDTRGYYGKTPRQLVTVQKDLKNKIEARKALYESNHKELLDLIPKFSELVTNRLLTAFAVAAMQIDQLEYRENDQAI